MHSRNVPLLFPFPLGMNSQASQRENGNVCVCVCVCAPLGLVSHHETVMITWPTQTPFSPAPLLLPLCSERARERERMREDDKDRFAIISEASFRMGHLLLRHALNDIRQIFASYVCVCVCVYAFFVCAGCLPPSVCLSVCSWTRAHTHTQTHADTHQEGTDAKRRTRENGIEKESQSPSVRGTTRTHIHNTGDEGERERNHFDIMFHITGGSVAHTQEQNHRPQRLARWKGNGTKEKEKGEIHTHTHTHTHTHLGINMLIVRSPLASNLCALFFILSCFQVQPSLPSTPSPTVVLGVLVVKGSRKKRECCAPF